MGSVICCSQSPSVGAKSRIVTSNKRKSANKHNFVLPDSSSTSDSQTQKYLYEELPRPQKQETFANFINQGDFEMSSIQKMSQVSECSQQKTFIKYLQKLQKQLSPMKEEKDSKLIESIILQSGKTKINIKLFIEHSTKCPTCYQLFQNLKNMEFQEPLMNHFEQEQNRISLRDSLLEFDQCQKAKRSVQCKCQVLNCHEEAEKAMRKFPNSNKYQSKNLKFRKTSLFEPQITEQRQSQESS